MRYEQYYETHSNSYIGNFTCLIDSHWSFMCVWTLSLNLEREVIESLLTENTGKVK